MGLKDFNEFSAEEIGLWLTAQGLGDEAPKFIEEGVDGDLLCSLTKDELKDDLGLSSLQAKKVLKNIEFSKHLKDAGEGGGEEAEKLKEEVDALQHAMKAKDDEIAALKHAMEKMKVSEHKSAPAPAPKPAPKPAPAPAPQQHRRQPGVVGGAARGAAGGAVKGAIVGAILPGMDAGDGAAAGAAVGTLKGGVGGLRGRRMRGR